VINDKSQGSVATHSRCGGIFNNYFTTNLFVSDVAVFVLKRDVKLQPTNQLQICWRVCRTIMKIA